MEPQKNNPYTSIFFGLSLLLLGACAYFYNANEALIARLSSVENKLAGLSFALEESNLLSEENQQQLQELSNRSDVIAQSQDELLTEAVAKASPAVVSIVISKDVALLEVDYVNPFGNDPFFRDFGFRTPVYRKVGTQSQQVGAGTGFIIREDGYVLTNKHVVSDKDADYTALLSTGEQKNARVVYKDPDNDIAILKIDGTNYPSITLGNSSEIKLGQTVAAIGNALGEYSNSVSVGIISGLDRTIEALDEFGRVETLEGMIQTDAAINRGNSGGPLLDLQGNAVGVNVAMERGANNIAFSIPIDTVKSITNSILPKR